MDKQKFYNNLMENPDSKTFYRLIRKNKAKSSEASTMDLLDENDQDIIDHENQTQLFAEFYEQLATPVDEDHYDKEYLADSELRYNLINNIVNHTSSSKESTQFTPEDIRRAISRLNKGKTADGYCITAEHFINAGDSITPNICVLFNNIMQEGRIPNIFKTGIITPVHKKGKDPKLTTNYRGITVTSVLGKIFEYAILDKLPEININQSELQFGFTQGLSPIMAALIVSEGILYAKQHRKNLYLVTLDSQKAFDVVHHKILLEKLYYEIPLDIWIVIHNLYTDMTSQVKWNNNISQKFSIQQGVRQGGVLSTHLYKLYINDLPTQLEEHVLGLTIGTEYYGSPLCADDIVLMSTDEAEIQLMLDIAYKYSCQYRYNIHPQKSTLVMTQRLKSNKQSESKDIMLGHKPIQKDHQTIHLGVIRADKNESKLNIQDHISTARKTLYSLIPVGISGKEGLNPKTAYKIYQAYVLPRLLYGLEILPLNGAQIAELRQFHIKTLRCFQSLPTRTATSIVHMLLGALPIEAELHKRQLSLLYSILASGNTKLEYIMERQLIVNPNNTESFFPRVQEILLFYGLQSIQELMQNLPSKLQWKKQINLVIQDKWTSKLQEEMQGKSTLVFCNTESLKIRQAHMIWDSIPPIAYEVKKAKIKVRLLTGTYLLQSDIQKFNNEQPQKCVLCQLEQENIEHFILRCPALT